VVYRQTWKSTKKQSEHARGGLQVQKKMLVTDRRGRAKDFDSHSFLPPVQMCI